MYKLIAILFISLSCLAVALENCTVKGVLFSKQKAVSFGAVTDLHYDHEGLNGYTYSTESNIFLRNIISQFNSRNLDFFISMGDMIDGNTTKDKELINLFNIETELLKFSGSIYSVVGNHDTEKISLSEYCSNSRIISEYNYSFIRNGYFFVIFYSTYKTMSQTRIGWLVEELAKNDLPTIVIGHYPLDCDGTGVIDLTNAPAVRQILENDGNVIAAFGGHYHENAYSKINGVRYYTLPSSSSSEVGAVVTIFNDGTIYIDGIGETKDRYF